MKVRALVFVVVAAAMFSFLPVEASEAARDTAPLQDSVQEEEIQLPDSYVDRVRKEGALLEISLKEAIRLALNNNLERAIENFNEEINREQIIRTRGFYDPVFAFTVGWSSSESPTRSELDAGGGVVVSEFKNFQFNNEFTQNVAGGGTFVASWTNSRFDTNSLFNFLNPSYNTRLNLQFTQPLMRGF